MAVGTGPVPTVFELDYTLEYIVVPYNIFISIFKYQSLISRLARNVEQNLSEVD